MTDVGAPNDPLRILCVGDLHIGREPALREDVLEAAGLKPRALSVVPAWEEAQRVAIEERVAAVLLAGDVVDSDDGFLAAYGPLSQGVRRLVDAKIPVLAVSGNHDTRVLPRLADEIPELRFLGRDGRWESEVIERDGRPALRVLGWSFPSKIVRNDPLDSLTAAQRDGRFEDGLDLPTVGLVHGDLDVSGSQYAPLSRANLENTKTIGWLLGHQHKPGDLGGERPIGYLGCVSGNDFGESGPRGPWIGTLEGGRLRLEQRPLAPLRLEEIEVDLSGVVDPQGLEKALTRSIAGLDAQREASACQAKLVMVRPRLVGRSPLGIKARTRVLEDARERAESIFESRAGTAYFLDRKHVDRVKPQLDLAALGKGSDPPAVLAQLILGLEEDREDVRPLVQRTHRAMVEEAEHKNFSRLEAAAVDREAARVRLVAAGYHALEELLGQRADPAQEASA